MIREIAAAAWAGSPWRVVAAIVLTPIVLWLLRAALVVAIVAGQP